MDTALCMISTALGLPLVLSYLASRSRAREKPSARVKRMWIYPVKSCGGMEVQEVLCTPMGLQYQGLIDRSFCIYGHSGQSLRILNLREAPQMTLIHCRVQDGRLVFSTEGMTDLSIDYSQELYRHKPSFKLKNSTDELTAVDCGDDAADWVSRALKQDGLRLGYSGFYLTNKMTNIFNEQEMYGDQMLGNSCAPVHILSEASLKDLRSRVPETKLYDDQFRQPILVDGCQPHDEDNWKDVHIGSARLYYIQPCGRCLRITTNPETGRQNPGTEPLATLRRYRMMNGIARPVFGIQLGLLVPDGVIRVGDPVYTTQR